MGFPEYGSTSRHSLGRISFSFEGVSFARVEAGLGQFGLGEKMTSSSSDIEETKGGAHFSSASERDFHKLIESWAWLYPRSLDFFLCC